VKECVIFCAAGFDGLAVPLTEEDYLIAADGGLKHMESLGVTPNAIIGDFDSLNYIPTGAEVFPVEKDDTDSMLAVKLGLSKGYDRFLLYGGLDGVRWTTRWPTIRPCNTWRTGMPGASSSGGIFVPR